VDQTRTAANAAINDLANEGITDYKFPRIDCQSSAVVPSNQCSVTAKALATQIHSDRGMKSAIAGPSDADNSSALAPTEHHANENDMKSYKALSLAPSGEVYDANVIKVSARKVAKPQSLKKAHLLNDTQSQWLPASQIPPAVLAKIFCSTIHAITEAKTQTPRNFTATKERFNDPYINIA
jgi:hypothetical protein